MMQKLFTRILTAIVALFITTVTFANPPMPPPAQQPLLVPSAPDINAKSYVLMDANSGKILTKKNMGQKYPPASLTKMMTLYLTSRALQTNAIKLTDKVRISEKAWKMGGSKMFVKVGDQVTVQDIIQGIIVDSGNDACVAIAQYIGGSEQTFTDLMNKQAQALGMTNTHYTDSTGLPHPQHYTTAHDLAILARALITNFPQDYGWYKQKWFTYNGIRQPNRNRLLWRYPYADGIKTGHTDSAGYCLVASAKKNSMRLITVVLGAPTDNSRADDSIKLLNYGFRFFNTHLIYPAGNAIATPRIWGGANKTTPAGLTQNLYVTTPRGQFQHVKVSVNLQKNVRAPVQKGQTLGQVVVSLNQKPITTQPLVALTNNPSGNAWRRSMDSVLHLFHKWFGSKHKKVEVKLHQTVAPQPTPRAAPTPTPQATTPAPATQTPAPKITIQPPTTPAHKITTIQPAQVTPAAPKPKITIPTSAK